MAEAELTAILPEREGHMVHVPFEGEDQVGAAHAAEGAGGRRVGVHRSGPDAHLARPVDRPEHEHRDARQERGVDRVGPAVEEHVDVVRNDLTVGRQRGADRHRGVLPTRCGEQVFLARVHQLHRPSGAFGQHPRIRLETDVELGTEASSDVVADHPHGRLGDAQGLGDPIADVEGKLVGHVDRVPAAFERGERHLGLEVGLVLARSVVGVLDDGVRGCERLVHTSRVGDHLRQHVAGPVPAIADRAELGPSRVHGTRVCCSRLVEVGERRERIDLDHDGGGGGRRLGGRVGHDGGERLALVGHVLVGEQRHVEQGDAGALVGHVRRRHDAVHTRHVHGSRRVDRHDPPRRDRRSHQPGVQHARQPVIDPVDGLATHLAGGVGPGG